MMSDDRRSIAQSIILTHTTLKDEKSCSIYSYHDIKHGRDHLVYIMLLNGMILEQKKNTLIE